MRIVLSLLVITNLFFRCTTPQTEEVFIEAPQWKEVELNFTAANTYSNPYTDVDVYVEFSGSDGQKLRRPAFWDGGQSWKIRFTSPVAEGEWEWQSHASVSRRALTKLC